VDDQGVYVPDTPGDQIVVAVVGAGLADTADVRVSSTPVLTGIVLTPADDTVDQGGSRQYTAAGSWSDGGTAQPVVDYSTTGGLIDSTGVLLAVAEPGDYVVVARERGGSRQGTSNVRIRPDDLVAIDVTPSSILLAPGGSHHFSATGRTADRAGLYINVTWAATGGTITSSGNFRAGSAQGAFRVIATRSGGVLADTAFVVIANQTATLTQLLLNPGAVTLPAGASTQFNVAGSWSDGSSASPAVVYSANGGSVTPEGDYTAPVQPGTYSVIARHATGTLADTSVVTVTAARLSRLTVAPGSVSLTSGATNQFTVSAQWTDGSTSTPALGWTATGGSITAGGLYIAGTSPGTYRVVVRDQAATAADTAFVTITSPNPVLQDIVVNPGAVSLHAGGAQQFYVQGVWTGGGTAVPAVTWSASGGSITAGGRFVAGPTAGTHHVIAHEPATGIADTAFVTVLPPAPVLTAIAVQPDPAILQPGAAQVFTVTGIWTNGGSGAPAVTWSATGGTINGGGVYTAGPVPGTFRVIAHQSGGSLADTAVVTVTSLQPQLIGLQISPDSNSVQSGSGLQYIVTGTWTNGGTGTPAVSWSSAGGAITAAGYFTAGASAGAYDVVATQIAGSLAVSTKVFVSAAGPTITMLRIEPDSLNLQAGMSYDFRGSARWSNGTTSRISNLVWTATGGTISSSGRYTAGTVGGTYRVIARPQGGGVADTARVRVNAATVVRINLTPASATVPVGGTQQFATSAVWSDGISRPVAVTYSATGGTITANGLYRAGQLAGPFAVIAACSCGVSDTSAVTLTGSAAGPATLTSLRISPKQVNLVPSGSIQFTATALWSNGASTAPPMSWSTTAGTVSSTGAYVAPSAVGTYRIIVAHTGGTLKDTATVSVHVR
jgi:hypothetical protein